MPLPRTHRPLLVAAFAALGCGGSDAPHAPQASPAAPDRVRVKTLLTRLQDADAKVRTAAMAEIEEQAEAGFDPRDGVRLLQEPARRPPGWPFAESLIWAAASRPGPDDVPAVLEAFPKYSPEGGWAALTLLARLPDRAAAEALVHLARTARPHPTGLPVGTLADRPRLPEVFFPALLDLLDRDGLRPGILRIAAAFAGAGLLEADTLRPQTVRLVALLYRELDGVPPGDPEGNPLGPSAPAVPGVPPADPDDLDDRSHVAGDLIDLLALLPGPATEAVLQRALARTSPDLAARSAVALIRQGFGISPEALAPAAADAATRLWLWGRLQELGQTTALPARFRTQEALAASEFVAWLARTPALGRPPDAIEPMGDYPAIGRLGQRTVYLFRFRVTAPEPLALRGWMAGWVSYPPDREPSLGGDPSTRFLPWDDRSPQGHVLMSQSEGGPAEDVEEN